VLSRHLRSALQSVGRGIKRADRLLTTLREEGLLESSAGRTLGAAIQAERDRLDAVIVEYAPDEAYHWTAMWQEGEQEIEDERLRGGLITFQDEDALDAVLLGR
jgi:hypothetical protein